LLLEAIQRAGFADVRVRDRRRNARTGHPASAVALIEARR
jgi:hypothetical protein